MTATTRDRADVDDGRDVPEQAPGDPAGRDREARDGGDDIVEERVGPVLRPLAVALLASAAAALMAGGIFGSWAARGTALFGVVFGVFWAYLAIWKPRRRLLLQGLILPAAFLAGLLSLIPTRGGPALMFPLMGDAVSAGRLLRPPVPFDPGWRPILIVLFALVGFAAAWVATALQRPQLSLMMALPVLFLTAISQPAEGEFVAAVVAFLPLLLALAVLFGGDMTRVSELGAAFEIKRAIRSVPLVVGGVALLVVLGNAQFLSFLFPQPVYDPTDKPQKPKSIPLGEVRDRVLFEVQGGLTGPWKTGTLDFYDGKSWRLAPFDPDRLEPVRGEGVVDRTRAGDTKVVITTRDLGTTSVLPGVPGPTKISVSDAEVLWDPRVGVFRMPEGAVPADLTYELVLPKYPEASRLRTAPSPDDVDPVFLDVPEPTAVVERLLDEAPQNPWERLDFVRKKLNDVVVAVGAGSPDKAVPPSKVDDLLQGSHEGTPFEIVAAETLLARWAGVPARIGYGFDGVNDEDGTKTVRPKNGSNWLEVYFEGYGWIPLIGTPPKAKASLDTDPNARFDPTIEPSDDVAVELYVPVELENLRHLYQRLQRLVLLALPWLLAAIATYLLLPGVRRALRRRRRRRWAEAEGRLAQVAVEYAEFRDAATDLNVGDPLDTPLEYLAKVAEDDEHAELAWLVNRALYGDLRGQLGEQDVEAAREMAASLRRRMYRAQPFQSRVLAFVSRASLRHPYTLEIPTVRELKLLPQRRRKPTARRSSQSRRMRLRRAVKHAVTRRS